MRNKTQIDFFDCKNVCPKFFTMEQKISILNRYMCIIKNSKKMYDET